MLVELKQNSTDSYMNVRVRVYDDGVGLRDEFPQKGNLNYFTIKEERTEFAMTGDHTAWWIPGDVYKRQGSNRMHLSLATVLMFSSGIPLSAGRKSC